MSTQFLLRPKPFANESLSSWRQRVGWANGYRLFSLNKGELRRSDPDLGLHESAFEWIAAVHNVTIGDVRQMTFRSMEGKVVGEIRSRLHPAWWLRARYGQSERSFGAMFCPLCLGEDHVPYFRLTWRLGFNVVCPRHSVLYLDQCQRCGSPPWPGGCGGSHHHSSHFTSFDHCWSCGELLSGQSVQSAVNINVCTQWLEQSHVEMAGNTVPVIEMFSALRAMCQIFLRTNTREKLLKSGKWTQIAAAFENSTARGNAVEYCQVTDRHLLIQAAEYLLTNWPSNFLTEMIDSDVTRSLFFGTTHMHPSWVDAVINTSLAKQNRWVTEKEVRRVVADLRSEGTPITKAEIWRRLKWWGTITPDWLS